MVSKRLSRAYAAPVPAGEVRQWAGNPPNNAGVLPLSGQAFNSSHFPELLAQHGDAVLPNKAPIDGVYSVVGHGQQGEVTLASNDTDVDFNEIVHDFGETIRQFYAHGDDIVVCCENSGKAWGSTDGGNNFVQLPSYLNCGTPANHSSNRYATHLKCGNGTWFVSYGNYVATCQGDITVPANWVTQPQALGLTNGFLTVDTDDNGTWMIAGQWHQFAWTHNDFDTINVDAQPNGSNYATAKVPYQNGANYSSPSFAYFLDGVWFAGSWYSMVYRSDDNLATFANIITKFNSGVNSDGSNPRSLIDCGSGHFICGYNGAYFSESFDYGLTWIRRSLYLGTGATVYRLASNKSDIVLLQKFSSPHHQIVMSKDDGQTFGSTINQDVQYDTPIQFYRDAWYGLSGDLNKIVRSVTGFVRTEWELA